MGVSRAEMKARHAPFASDSFLLELVLHLLEPIHHVTPYQVDAARDTCYFGNSISSFADICLYGMQHFVLADLESGY